MLTNRFALAIILALSLILIPAYGCAAPTGQELQLKTTTQQIQQAVQTELNKLDLDLSDAAAKLSRTGLTGPEARQILYGLISKYPFLIDSAITDTTGKMVTVAPDTSYEGYDISQQAVTIKFWETKQPLLSQMFTAVEGMDAVVIMWPILSENGDFMGSLSALFKPETLFAAKAKPILEGTGITVHVLQLDGLNIYDSEWVNTGNYIPLDPEIIKELSADPRFSGAKDVLELGPKIVAEESGRSGSYLYVDNTGKHVKKQAFWVSVGLHGTAWRVVSNQQVAE